MPRPSFKRRSSCNCNKNYTSPLYYTENYNPPPPAPTPTTPPVVEDFEVTTPDDTSLEKSEAPLPASDKRCNTENVCEYIKNLEHKIHILTQKVHDLQKE